MSDKRYNHTCTIAFTVVSNSESGEDFTREMLYEALVARAKSLLESSNSGEFLEAVGAPYDTYEMGDDQ